ncbi:FkbM family methyltransferase [Ruegeria marisrubri]|uniref:FkbM family methyltransferase n=1 Tax=Ruegeria marisrubri TaxID=1685379 RepID=UPI0009E85226|nr:FkbM family methyltransferase [Ruegeria marisrubri]
MSNPDCRDEQVHSINFDGKTFRIILPDSSTDHIQKQVSVSRVPYEADLIRDILKRIIPNSVIFDVGANIGNHTLALAAHGANVTAFEPDARLVSYLRESININSFSGDVSIVNAAVGASKGKGHLEGGSLENIGMQHFSEDSQGSINLVTLDDFRPKKRVSVLKIDVEGMERQVLDGAIRLLHSDKPFVYAEASSPSNLDELVEWAQEFDYTPINIFNETPTICFAPKENDFSSESAYDLLRASFEYYQKSRLHEKKIQKHLEQIRELASDQSLLSKEKEIIDLQLSNLKKQVNILQAEVATQKQRLASSEAQNRKIKKREKRARIVALTAGLPVLAILSPIILPALIVHRFKKGKKENALTLSRNGGKSYDVNEEAILVSIVVPVHNGEEFIAEAIDSALRQTHENIEIIVVDDGSNDRTLEVVKAVSDADSRVKLIPLFKNFGCYYARNRGLLAATGDYICFLDADDKIHPERVREQLRAVLKDEVAVASQCQQRRWSKDFQKPMGELKYGENSLFFHRSVFQEIGFYDFVRYAGDSEYRERLLTAFGPRSIKRVERELYFLRTVSGSLTLSSGSHAYSTDGDTLKDNLSPTRTAYRENFRKWHSDIKLLNLSPRIEFTQRTRPFPLGEIDQNASPFLGEKLVGMLATFPERQEILRRTLPSMLSQLDELHVYLNNYDYVPEFLKMDGVHPILGRDALGDLRDNGKFYEIEEKSGYIFTFDDDIFYPSDYVSRLVSEIETLDRKAVVGVHGVVFPKEKLRYTENRTVFHFQDGAGPFLCDLLGTGTVAFHSSTLPIAFEDFGTSGICDLWFAIACHRHNVPLVSIARNKNWLIEAKKNVGAIRLFDEAKEQDRFHTELYHSFLYPIVSSEGARSAAAKKLLSLFGRKLLDAYGLRNEVYPENNGRSKEILRQ